MLNILKIPAAATILLLGLNTTLNANLIVNGSFEDGASHTGTIGLTNNDTTVPGWTHNMGDDIESWWAYSGGGNWLPYAQEGNYFIHLDSNHGNASGFDVPNYIEQTVTLVQGQTYELTFYFAGEATHSVPDDCWIDLELAGNAVNNTTITYQGERNFPLSQSTVAWNQGTYTFTATQDGSATIRFRDNTQNIDSNISLDNISLVAVVPEPATIIGALLLAGASFGHFIRRKE